MVKLISILVLGVFFYFAADAIVKAGLIIEDDEGHFVGMRSSKYRGLIDYLKKKFKKRTK